MMLLIDGYNVLRHLYPHTRGMLDRERSLFIAQLGRYCAEVKGIEVIVVFDGGLLAHATREVRNGVVVMFAGRKKTADDWIVDYAERHRSRELVLVSRDRALGAKVQRLGVELLAPDEFCNALVQRTAERVDGQDLPVTDGVTIKYVKDDDGQTTETDTTYVDMLMTHTVLGAPKEEAVSDSSKQRHSQGKHLSKREKSRSKKLKKLRLP